MLDAVAHDFNPSTGSHEASDLCEFKDNWIYAEFQYRRDTKRDPDSKIKYKHYVWEFCLLQYILCMYVHWRP
jgi:hypothetical protein